MYFWRPLQLLASLWTHFSFTPSNSITTSKFQLSDGANILVKVLGDGPGKPLLIVHHGAPGVSSHAEPEASFGFLADAFRVVVFDARGSGASDPQPPYTNDRWVADVEELRIWAGADKFILAGGSYGGFIGMEYALQHPDKLVALILRDTLADGLKSVRRILHTVTTSPLIHPDLERQGRLFAGKTLDNEDLKAAFEEILPLYAPPREGSARYPFVARSSRGGAERLYHYATHNAAFSENIPKYDLRPKLKNITAPTLVVVGRHDKVAPLDFSEEIHLGIPGSQLAIFEKSGHTPPSDEPEAFQARVREFIGGLNF